jgi:hypothetical protein
MHVALTNKITSTIVSKIFCTYLLPCFLHKNMKKKSFKLELEKVPQKYPQKLFLRIGDDFSYEKIFHQPKKLLECSPHNIEVFEN